VVTVASGIRAIDRIGNDSSIELILMDIDLGPGMSGPDAAREILKTNDIPIVFLTSHSEREMVYKVRAITMYGYVIKNSGDFVLLTSIEMAFELFEAHMKLKKTSEQLAESEQSIRRKLDSILMPEIDLAILNLLI
jgi:DNA-binding NarL/FixJ family response regulator